MKLSLKTTTAMALILAMANPAIGIAQATDGTVKIETEDAVEATEETADEAVQETTETAEETTQEAEEVVEETAETTEDVAEETTEATEQVAEENAETTEEAAEETAEATEEPATEAATTEAETAATEEPDENTEETTANVESSASEGDQAVSSENAEAELKVEAETTQAEPEAETSEITETQTAETETETVAEDDSAGASGDTGKTDTAATETDTDGPATETETTETATGTESETTEAVADTEAETTETAETSEPEARQEDTAESTQDANETPEVAATAETEAESETRTEEVSAENTRQSGEEFESNQSAATAENSDEGLSNFEKFALGAAGIGILAAILNDRNEEVVSTSKDRVVVSRGDGDYYILKDDNALLRQPGSTVETTSYSDGSTRQVITLKDGTRVTTVRAPNGQVLSRTTQLPDGSVVELFDDTQEVEPVKLDELPETEERVITAQELNDAELRAALEAERLKGLDRRFTLQQVRQIRAVRELMPVIELSAVTFETGSAVIRASQAEALTDIGQAMARLVAENPGEIFMVEGHTDAVGSAGSNLALSDRRAESVALALTEYFDVPPQNLIVQGYGESNLKVQTDEAERANRRAAVRRITPLLQKTAMR